MNARYAIYFVPEPETALALLGSALFGRDSETGREIPPIRLPGFSPQSLRSLTENARRYGLHATLKAPFFLKPGLTERDLLLSAAHFALDIQAATLPRLELARIGSFFALVPPEESPEERKAVERINALAAEAVAFFDPFRATPSEQELARREAQSLTARQRALLSEWGYPYVFDEYRFHITLTDTLSADAQARRMGENLRAYFAPVCNGHTVVSSVCVCKQTPNGHPFMLLERFCLQG